MSVEFEKKKAFDIIAFHTNAFESYPPMFHPHLELILVKSGSIHMIIDGAEKTIQAGEGCLLFPFLTHSYEATQSTDAYVLLFSASATSFEQIFKQLKPKSPFFVAPELEQLLARAIILFRTKEDFATKTAFGYLNAALGEILKNLELYETETLERDVATSALEYCSLHFRENISIASVAKELFISESYLSKIFSKRFKYKFREYINKLRVVEAKKLLANTCKKIVDIMLDCGFQNQSSFNRVFYAECNMTPNEYRHFVKSSRSK